MAYRRIALLVLMLLTMARAVTFAHGGPLYSIAEEIAQNERLTTVSALLNRFADLEALLNDPSGDFTFFAPVDGAWTYTDSEGAEVDLASALSDPVFAEILLRYYIVPRRILFTSSIGTREYGTMLPGYSVKVQNIDTTQHILNDISTVTDQIPAENGLIMLLDSALPISTYSEMGRVYQTPSNFAVTGLPMPAQVDASVIDVLTEAGDFTIMLRFFEAFPQVAQRLENGGLYTLIAPTDAAFLDNGYSGMIEFALADRSEEGAGVGFLQSRLLPGYFDIMSLRQFVGEEGRTLQFQTLDSYAEASVTAFDPATGTVDGQLRIMYSPVNEQPLLARNVIIHVQEQLEPPG